MIGQKVLEGRSIRQYVFGLGVAWGLGRTMTSLGVQGPPVCHTDCDIRDPDIPCAARAMAVQK